MTGVEWLSSTDPTLLLEQLAGKTSERKLRLFICACSFRYVATFDDPTTAAAAALLERFADGIVGEEERLRPNTFQHNDLICGMWRRSPHGAALRTIGLIVGDYGRQFNHGPQQEQAIEEALMEQAILLRDIIGNPFRPVAFDPAWQTSIAVAIAEGIYDDRAFDRLPILADALQDAGCEDAAVLGHLRGDGPHVRGCWALDLVLGKE